MAAYIIASVVASFGFAYVCDTLVADQKILGGENTSKMNFRLSAVDFDFGIVM